MYIVKTFDKENKRENIYLSRDKKGDGLPVIGHKKAEGLLKTFLADDKKYFKIGWIQY